MCGAAGRGMVMAMAMAAMGMAATADTANMGNMENMGIMPNGKRLMHKVVKA